MKHFKYIFFILILLSLNSCATYKYNSMYSGSAIIHLNENQYTFVGDIEGSAVYKEYFWGSFRYYINQSTQERVDYSEDSKWYDYKNLSLSFSNQINIQYPTISFYINPENMAIYDAVKRNQDADFLIYPKFEIETTGIPPLFKVTKVKVRGKGIKLNE